MRQPVVMLVHYDPRQIRALTDALESGGYEVSLVSDGDAALRSFERINPDLVVVETMIPRRNGFEVCRDLKKTRAGKRIPVVVTSTVFKGWRYRSEALHTYGCQEFLGRGFSPTDLLQAVQRLLPSAFLDEAGAWPTSRESTESPDVDQAIEQLGPGTVPGETPIEEVLQTVGEGEISNVLESLFPSADSGELIRQLKDTEDDSTSIFDIDAEAPDAIQPMKQRDPTINENRARILELDPENGNGTSSAPGASAAAVEIATETPAHEQTAVDPLPDLDPRALPGVPPAADSQAGEIRTREVVRQRAPQPAFRNESLDPPAVTRSKRMGPIYIVAALVIAVVMAVLWWLSAPGELGQIRPEAPNRPASEPTEAIARATVLAVDFSNRAIEEDGSPVTTRPGPAGRDTPPSPPPAR